MKFDDVRKTRDKKPKDVVQKKFLKSKEQYNIIDSAYRYGNVGVYVLKNGKKGLFREIATFINNGEKPTTWALKVFHTDAWYIQFGINPNIDLTNNDIYLSELLSAFEEKYDNIEISGNRKVALISGISDRYQAEQVVNYLINMFQDVELDFESIEINERFILDESKKPMRIVGFYPEEKQDDESREKFVGIFEKLKKVRLSEKDQNNFNIVKKRILKNAGLRDKDKKILNDLMKDYLSTHERVSIAMKYLKKEQT